MQASPGRETGHFLPPCPSLPSTQTPSMAILLYPLGPTHRFPLGARESAGPEFPISGEHQPRSGLARQPTLTPPASAGPKVLSHSLKVRLAHSCRVHTLCAYSMNYTVHGILQARVLEWVAFPFYRGSSQSRDQTQVSRIAGRLFIS